VRRAFVPGGLGIGYEVDMEEVLKHNEQLSFKYMLNVEVKVLILPTLLA
jgi:hypothetical protein